jgi:magnesium transporter
MLSQLLKPEIEALIKERNLSTLKEALSDWPPNDIAELMAELEENEQAIIFRLLPHDLATDVFEYLDFDMQMTTLKAMGKEDVASILNEMAPDDRTALLEELPSAAARQLMMLLSADERKVAQNLLGYPESSIGRLMTPNYIAVKPEWNIEQALQHIREHGKESETLNILYVIDDKGKLIDDIKIRDLILAQADSSISDIMDDTYIALNATDDQEKAVATFKRYDRVAVPVIDSFGVLLGIVTHDDVLDVAEEEATEDIHKIGGVTALEESYASISVIRMVRKRVFWLTILFVAQVLTAIAMGYFEDQLARAVVLSIFIPLVISSGGNSGAQAATLVIRALALGEVTLIDWWIIMRREIMSGFLLGCILGIIGFIEVQILAQFIEALEPHSILVGITVGLALIGIVLWGTLAGSMLPFLLKKLGLDPATSSAPLVATIVDVTGLVIYFSVSILILSGSLL